MSAIDLPPVPARIASVLAGHPVTVVALDPGAWRANASQQFPDRWRSVAAYTTVGGNVIVMPAWTAAYLQNARNAEAAQVGWAANILAHEAAHDAGIADECECERRAGSTQRRVLELLGLHGRRLREAIASATYSTVHSPNHGGTP